MKARIYSRDELDRFDEVCDVMNEFRNEVVNEFEAQQQEIETLRKQVTSRRKNGVAHGILAVFLSCLFCTASLAAIQWEWQYGTNPDFLDAFMQDPRFEQLRVNGTLTLANDATLANSTNGAFTWTEASENLIWTFTSNDIAVTSTTGVLNLDFDTIIVEADEFILKPVADANTTEGTIYYDSDTDIAYYRNASAWVAFGGGTFTGGNITSDCTLSDGVDLQSTTTTGQAATIKVYDNDTGPAYTNVLSWTNGNVPAIAIGSDTSTIALNSTTIDIAAGVVTGIAGLTGTGTFSINDSATTNTTSIGGGTTTGAVSVATGASAQTIDVGTGAGAKTISLGSTNTTSTTNVNSGSGGVNVNLDNNQPTNIGTGTTTGAITIGGAGTQTIAVGTGAAAKTVSLGSTNSTSTTTISSGSNGVNINASNNQPTNLNTGTSTGALALGGGNGTVAIDSSDWDISAIGAMTGIGAITADGLITGSLGATISGATTSINASSNFATNINTGTSSGAIALGGGSGTFAVASTGLDISTAGAISNVTTLGVGDAITLSDGATIDQPANNYFEITENSDTLQLIFGSNVLELGSGGTGVVTIDFNDVDRLEDIEYISGDNGAKVDLSINERIEFKDAAETFGFELDASNTVEFCTDSGVTTIDCNDVDQFIDVESITGDNGVKIDVSMDERVEFKDGTESFGFLLNGANQIIFTTDTGATSIDMNDVDQLIGVEYVQGDNSQKVDFSIDARIEFSDASETFGLIFTANTVTLSTDSGVATVDVNDVDAWTGFESITGEGTGALGGFLKTVTNDTDGKTLTVAESGTVQTNAGAGGAAAWTLPTAAAGLEYTFVVMAVNELRVTPAAGDVINIAGTAGDAAEYWTANAAGETLHLIAVDATNWIAISSTGTWTQQTP